MTADAPALPTTYPKSRCRQLAPLTYQVQVQLGPRQPWGVLGRVQRFGSLPSMRGWQALADADGAKWTRKQQTRGEAVADLITEQLGAQADA